MSKFLHLMIIIATLLTSCKVKTLNTGFSEPVLPMEAGEEIWTDIDPVLNAAFGSIDIRYEHHLPPDGVVSNEWSGTAWKGERVYAQLVLWSADDIRNIKISAEDMEAGGNMVIGKENISIHPVRYVITDAFLNGCGRRNHDTIKPSLAADLLDNNRSFNLFARTLRPVWISINVPGNAKAGEYKGRISVNSRGGRKMYMEMELHVQDLLLPPPSEWSYHLDLWQNPFAVARFHNVKVWSDEHWALLSPYLQMLAKAGQKCITASILHRPWGGQTFDPFESMISWTHLGENKWEYDYSIFNRWVKLAMKSGITRQINCYSMVPWGNQVSYYDKDSASFVTLTLKPGSDEYMRIWKPFLEGFRENLRTQGWLDKTFIAMDERDLEEMRNMVALLKDAAPEFKIALAGHYLEELNDDLYDLCVFIQPQLQKEKISERLEKGMITTFYTCCARPEHPNNFTFSPPAEQAWLGWHAASRGFNGYLRWAYNSWVENPLQDSRFRTWPAGDTYQIYPGPLSSIRFERLREGIQDFEKIRILREMAESRGGDSILKQLEGILDNFTLGELRETPAELWLNRGKDVINMVSENLIR